MLNEFELDELTHAHRNQFLDDLLKTVVGLEGHLSDSLDTQQKAASDNQSGVDPAEIRAIIEGLKQQDVRLPDFPLAAFLSKVNLKKSGLTDIVLHSNLGKYSCYLLEVPLTLLADRGYEFSRIDCQIDFGMGRPTDQRCIAYAMYPDREYTDLAKTSLDFTVALGEDFQLHAAREVDQLGTAKANLSGKSGLSFSFPAREYGVKLATVQAEGAGTSKVFWRLTDQRYGREDRVKLSVILLVPKGLNGPIEAKATLVGYLAYNFWAVPLGKLFEHLGKKITGRLKNGLPLAHQLTWDLRPHL